MAQEMALLTQLFFGKTFLPFSFFFDCYLMEFFSLNDKKCRVFLDISVTFFSYDSIKINGKVGHCCPHVEVVKSSQYCLKIEQKLTSILFQLYSKIPDFSHNHNSSYSHK